MTSTAAPTRTPRYRRRPQAVGDRHDRSGVRRAARHPRRNDYEQLPFGLRDPVYRTILVPLDGSHFADGRAPDRPRARGTVRRHRPHGHRRCLRLSSLQRIRVEAARALGTDPDDPRIHVEVDTDVAGAVQRCASELDACLICLSTHGRGRVPAPSSDPPRATSSNACRAACRRRRSLSRPPRPRRWDRGPTPLAVDHLVACVDGTAGSEPGLPVAAAWAHALGMKLTLVTVAEPCPPPVRIGEPWRRHHGPNEDADEYVRRLGEQWAPAAARTRHRRRLRPDRPRHPA